MKRILFFLFLLSGTFSLKPATQAQKFEDNNTSRYAIIGTIDCAGYCTYYKECARTSDKKCDCHPSPSCK